MIHELFFHSLVLLLFYLFNMKLNIFEFKIFKDVMLDKVSKSRCLVEKPKILH